MSYVADTHSLIWYMTRNKNLSSVAFDLFKKADEGKERIIIPSIIFFELLYLIEKKKLPIDFDKFIQGVKASIGYQIESLTIEIIAEAKNISRTINPDPWDRLIAATSKYLNVPLITKDRKLQKVGISTIW